MISPIAALYGNAQHGYFYNLFFIILVFSVGFMWAKTLLESWVIFVAALIISHKQKRKVNRETLFTARKVVILLFALITLVGIPLEHQDMAVWEMLVSILFLSTVYVLHMYITYRLTKHHLNNLYIKYLV